MVATVVLAIVAGCGPGSGSPPVSATESAAPTTPITHATGAADLVLRAARGGGMLPMEMRLAEMPDISVYGDGRVIMAGDGTTGASGSLLPHLVEARLTPEGMTVLLAAAGDAGLLGPDRRLGLEGAYDLWSVTFTLAANGATHTTWAYALGFQDEERLAPPDEMPARNALDELFSRLLDLPGWLGPERIGPASAHRPARMRVYVAPDMTWAGDAGSIPATARPGQDVREWPLDAPPDVFGTLVEEREGTWRCGLLEWEAAERLGVVGATRDTRWRAGDRLYRVVARPVLPDEAGCPA